DVGEAGRARRPGGAPAGPPPTPVPRASTAEEGRGWRRARAGYARAGGDGATDTLARASPPYRLVTWRRIRTTSVTVAGSRAAARGTRCVGSTASAPLSGRRHS